jgi:HD-GYP domain-containing protein (c-di-GMP phosphodiesterase class II)
MPFAALLELHLRSSRRYQGLKELLVGLTRSLTSALDAKDSYTYGHSERVARIAVELGRELGLREDEISDVYLAGLLHDVGKIGIRDEVLLKPGSLTPEEFDHLKQHVTIGYSILSDLRPIRHLLPGVLYHHEQWDGSGYPDGLAGEAIPLLARILAVADAYDAMSTRRPYRDALPSAQVEETLRKGAGGQWDKRVIEAFQRCRERIHVIRQRGVGESLCHAIDGALRTEESVSPLDLAPAAQVG